MSNYNQSVKSRKPSSYDIDKPPGDQSLLETVEAYVKLKFPNEIDALRDEKDPKVLFKEQSRVLAGLTNFFLG